VPFRALNVLPTAMRRPKKRPHRPRKGRRTGEPASPAGGREMTAGGPWYVSTRAHVASEQTIPTSEPIAPDARPLVAGAPDARGRTKARSKSSRSFRPVPLLSRNRASPSVSRKGPPICRMVARPSRGAALRSSLNNGRASLGPCRYLSTRCSSSWGGAAWADKVNRSCGRAPLQTPAPSPRDPRDRHPLCAGVSAPRAGLTPFRPPHCRAPIASARTVRPAASRQIWPGGGRARHLHEPSLLDAREQRELRRLRIRCHRSTTFESAPPFQILEASSKNPIPPCSSAYPEVGQRRPTSSPPRRIAGSRRAIVPQKPCIALDPDLRNRSPRLLAAKPRCGDRISAESFGLPIASIKGKDGAPLHFLAPSRSLGQAPPADRGLAIS